MKKAKDGAEAIGEFIACVAFVTGWLDGGRGRKLERQNGSWVATEQPVHDDPTIVVAPDLVELERKLSGGRRRSMPTVPDVPVCGNCRQWNEPVDARPNSRRCSKHAVVTTRNTLASSVLVNGRRGCPNHEEVRK